MYSTAFSSSSTNALKHNLVQGSGTESIICDNIDRFNSQINFQANNLGKSVSGSFTITSNLGNSITGSIIGGNFSLNSYQLKDIETSNNISTSGNACVRESVAILSGQCGLIWRCTVKVYFKRWGRDFYWICVVHEIM